MLHLVDLEVIGPNRLVGTLATLKGAELEDFLDVEIWLHKAMLKLALVVAFLGTPLLVLLDLHELYDAFEAHYVLAGAARPGIYCIVSADQTLKVVTCELARVVGLDEYELL
jgi:hypothetical protein